MKDFFIWTFLFFLPSIITVIFNFFGYVDSAVFIGVLSIPYYSFIIYKLYKYVKKLDDYNKKRFWGSGIKLR